ncbi:MAG: nucleotidyltransferase domain-containing protein [Roseiflexus sp.]|nr:nucleotidyltransferase domain-containing protein [Roseiflexus sp.]
MQQPPSSSTVRIISLDREALLARLRAIAAQIRRECDVEDIRVFGSLARGDATGTSDVDVLIIVRHSTEADMVRRILSFLPYFDLDRGTDLLVYIRAEPEQQLAAQNPFLHRIWRESLPL